MRPRGRFFGHRLHHRLFFWFGAAIMLSGMTVLVVIQLVGGRSPWRRDIDRVRSFVEHQLERAWDDEAARAALADDLARDLDADVTLRDASGAPLLRSGSHPGTSCHGFRTSVPVVKGGVTVGGADLCFQRGGRPADAFRVALALAAAGVVLWAAAGAIARRLSRPLWELVRVTQEIGAGKYSSRVPIRRRQSEFAMVGCAVNDMAARIERQIAEQRELLAAVSHEIRTPLARIRLLVEMARDRDIDSKLLDELDREVVEIDQLVGELLASSRLEFSALSVRRLDPVEVAKRALERGGVAADKLEVVPGVRPFAGDPTLVARALANLLDNARKHGGGIGRVRVIPRDGLVAFEVDDSGDGFVDGDEAKVFDPFFTNARDDHASLGLGLALVRRIAEAHGGRAYAENRAEGGARVGIELALDGPRKASA